MRRLCDITAMDDARAMTREALVAKYGELTARELLSHLAHCPECKVCEHCE